MKNGFWTSDFIVEDDIVLVKKTGHRFALDLKLWHDIFTWFCFYSAVQIWRTQRFFGGHRRPKICFLPSRPRPWYLIWAVTGVVGAKVVDEQADADIVMHFDDSTTGDPPIPELGARAAHVRTINFACNDTSKSTVASIRR